MAGLKTRLHLGLAALLLSGPADVLFAESLTLNTYYPASYGVYTKLITTKDAYLATKSGGKVGIGTVTPGQLLDVHGGSLMLDYAGGSTGLMLQATNGGNNLTLWNDSGNTVHLTNTNMGLQLGSASGTVMTLTGGRVGIGTTAPASALHIVGSAQVSQNLPIGQTLSAPRIAASQNLTVANARVVTSVVCNGGLKCSVIGNTINVSLQPGYCIPDSGSCSGASGCGLGATAGVDNCGLDCTRTNPPCPCAPTTCSASPTTGCVMDFYGRSISGTNNCGGPCSVSLPKCIYTYGTCTADCPAGYTLGGPNGNQATSFTFPASSGDAGAPTTSQYTVCSSNTKPPGWMTTVFTVPTTTVYCTRTNTLTNGPANP